MRNSSLTTVLSPSLATLTRALRDTLDEGRLPGRIHRCEPPLQKVASFGNRAARSSGVFRASIISRLLVCATLCATYCAVTPSAGSADQPASVQGLLKTVIAANERQAHVYMFGHVVVGSLKHGKFVSQRTEKVIEYQDANLDQYAGNANGGPLQWYRVGDDEVLNMEGKPSCWYAERGPKVRTTGAAGYLQAESSGNVVYSYSVPKSGEIIWTTTASSALIEQGTVIFNPDTYLISSVSYRQRLAGNDSWQPLTTFAVSYIKTVQPPAHRPLCNKD